MAYCAKLFFTLTTICMICSSAYCTAGMINRQRGERNPFMSHEEASQMLGHSDLGRLGGLTTRLGLRADMEYGWEELMMPNIKPGESYAEIQLRQLESALSSMWVRASDRHAITEAIMFGSLTRLGYVSDHMAANTHSAGIQANTLTPSLGSSLLTFT